MYKINEVAKFSNVSIRTLHYYDEIDLLKPRKDEINNYRLYSDDDLLRLQQILFYKSLGFKLGAIKEILDNPSFDPIDALFNHRKVLETKQKELNQLIYTVDQTIKQYKGEVKMTKEEIFKGFTYDGHNEYEREAREKWGDEAVNQSNKAFEKKNADTTLGEMNRIYFSLADVMTSGAPVDSLKAQAYVKQWHGFLNSQQDIYTLEVFEGLADMYLADERFKKNIDQFGEGFTAYLSAAMKHYVCEKE